MPTTAEPIRTSGKRSLVDWGVELPRALFVSEERWHSERIGALALYCSDGRWGDAFDDFCHHHLLIPRYDRWAVPGGPAWLAVSDDSQEFARAAREQLDFLAHAQKLNRIVLITHFGCAVYADRLKRPADQCLPSQIDDVRMAAETLRAAYPGIRVEAYLAMRNDGPRPSLLTPLTPGRAEGGLTRYDAASLSFHRLDQ